MVYHINKITRCSNICQRFDRSHGTMPFGMAMFVAFVYQHPILSWQLVVCAYVFELLAMNWKNLTKALFSYTHFLIIPEQKTCWQLSQLSQKASQLKYEFLVSTYPSCFSLPRKSIALFVSKRIVKLHFTSNNFIIISNVLSNKRRMSTSSYFMIHLKNIEDNFLLDVNTI